MMTMMRVILDALGNVHVVHMLHMVRALPVLHVVHVVRVGVRCMWFAQVMHGESPLPNCYMYQIASTQR